jgi:hypothetical protein
VGFDEKYGALVKVKPAHRISGARAPFQPDLAQSIYMLGGHKLLGM